MRLFSPRKKMGFTLIELMIVVAIISIIAVFLIPSFIRQREKARSAKTESARSTTPEKSLESTLSPLRQEMIQAPPPVIESANISMALSASHARIGMDVYTRYEVTYRGNFVLMNPGAAGAPVRLDFQFPSGTVEARDVSLKFREGNMALEPEGVQYDQKGIFWVGTIPAGNTVTAEVSFIASGRERFVYYLPPASRIRSMKISLHLEGMVTSIIPDQALQPSQVQNKEITWNYNNLVTNRAIIIDLPGAQSPLGKLMVLCKLVGLAVLLFGAGFWYLVELTEAGRLVKFRLGHFLLLALTYSLFFIIFAVLGFHGRTSTWTSMLIAGVFSIPLLMLHVSRIISMSFALTRTLPLSLFTLGIVINGVYGEVYRDYIFIGAAFLVIAFVTITYGSFSEKREKWQKAQEKQFTDLIAEIDKAVLEARKCDIESMSFMKSPGGNILPESFAGMEKVRKDLATHFDSHESLLTSIATMSGVTDSGARAEMRSSLNSTALLLASRLSLSVKELEGQMKSVKEAFEETMRAAKESREGVEMASPEAKPSGAHCTACGYAIGDYNFCPQCGTMKGKFLRCGSCGEIISLPIHLMKPEGSYEELFCFNCGQKYPA